MNYQFNARGYTVHQVIVEMVRPQTRVLDIGCASGYVMAMLRDKRGCHCTGIEIDYEAAKAAEREGFRVIVEPAARAVKRVPQLGPFDYVIFADVLEHLADPDVVLRDSARLLSGDGRVIVSLPNIVSLRARLRILRGKWEYEDFGIFDRSHLRFYSIEGGRRLLATTGFKILEQAYVGPLTFYGGRRLAPVTRALPGLLANQMVFEAVAKRAPVDSSRRS
jgi:methionine biosynthesis protein MetW